MPCYCTSKNYEKAWKAVIMPPRQQYTIYDLGPPQFVSRGNKIIRNDLKLKNKHGNEIECSFYVNTTKPGPLPCLIYLHANGCCRLESMQYKEAVLSNSMHFFCFDFSGCGLSGGERSSLGWYEQDDIECVVKYLLNSGKVTKCGLWGRSMGSIAAMLYAEKHNDVGCIIVDSPFADFKRLSKEFAKNKVGIPFCITLSALKIFRCTIKSKGHFDLDHIAPIKIAPKIKTPCLFGAAKDDTFVSPQHTKDIFMQFAGPKRLHIFEGDHNTRRPIEFVMAALNHLRTYLFDQKQKEDFSASLNYGKPGQGLSYLSNARSQPKVDFFGDSKPITSINPMIEPFNGPSIKTPGSYLATKDIPHEPAIDDPDEELEHLDKKKEPEFKIELSNMYKKADYPQIKSDPVSPGNNDFIKSPAFKYMANDIGKTIDSNHDHK